MANTDKITDHFAHLYAKSEVFAAVAASGHLRGQLKLRIEAHVLQITIVLSSNWVNIISSIYWL